MVEVDNTVAEAVPDSIVVAEVPDKPAVEADKQAVAIDKPAVVVLLEVRHTADLQAHTGVPYSEVLLEYFAYYSHYNFRS